MLGVKVYDQTIFAVLDQTDVLDNGPIDGFCQIKGQEKSKIP